MWYTAKSASITNGDTVIAVTTGDDISIIQEDSGLIFEGESPVQVKRGYIDGSGDKFIELASPWPYTAKTNQPLVAYPTDASFAEATAELRRVIDTLSVASTVEAQEGTDDEKIMTPLKTKQAIDFNTGTAASKDIVTSNTDATAGRLLTVGSFGLGVDPSYTTGSALPTNDIDSFDNPSGFYLVASGAIGTKPDNLVSNGVVNIIIFTQDKQCQIWKTCSGDNEMYMRQLPSREVGWGAWTKIYHSGNTNFNEFGGEAANDFIGSVTDRNSVAARFYRPLSGWVSAPSSISVTGTFKITTRGSNVDIITGITASDIVLETPTSNCELNANIRNIDGTLINPNLEYVLVSETSSSKITAVA